MADGGMEELIRLMTAYDNSEEPKPLLNYPATVYGLIIPFMVVSYICVVLRIYTRVKLQCLGWDDLFVVLFRVSATVGSIFLLLALNNGFGDHVLTIGMDNIVEFQKKFYVCLATYTISTTLMKLCLLSQFLRIFEAGTQARLICWIGLGISAVWGLGFSFCALFPCFPVSGFWDWTSEARCYGFGSKVPAEIAGAFAGHTASNAVLDAMVLAIPIPLYFRKTTTWKQRLNISLLLLLGVIVNFLSIWRLQTIVENKAGTYPVLDPTWYGPKSIILAALEVDLASICASIPTFWPIFRQRLRGGNIFVTQEVHITHQHRRLSSEDDPYEMQPPFGRHSRMNSEASLNGTVVRITSKTVQDKRSRDSFILDRVLPLGMHNKETSVESQIMSDGHRGFEREQERLRLGSVDNSNNGSNRIEKM
ncbi:hypothetical protein GGR54DRAFT_33533 [Hypoxylon sp. NC1633]|nr:hypothetical protein GGR54DRAFT_33533 [Hypoxylon sp. NC1633]